MSRLRYKYNPETCRYEPFVVKGKVLRRRIFTFFAFSFLIAVGGYFTTVQYVESISALALEQENRELKLSWNVLHKKITSTQEQLNGYIAKDDHNYRVILDSSPLEKTIREAGFGGREKSDDPGLNAYPYMLNDYLGLQKLNRQVEIELQSYDELNKILDEKLLSWAARPAIQPINYTQLQRLHLTYGTRFHPIFKVNKDHKGLDFAAAHGTPVYATGDGKILKAYSSDSYGNVIFVDHGFGFESRYAHLSAFGVQEGETVKRGQVIGFVGNTGNSVAPHLHYEILINGEHVNPINFFQRDLSHAEYQKLIEHASDEILSLD